MTHTSRILLCCLILSASLVNHAHADAIYKWQDADGVIHYGNVMPPQAAGRPVTTFDKRGLVIQKTGPAPTAEQRQQEEAQQASQAKQQRDLMEQKRHDSALLNTYSSANEIDIARRDNLQQIQQVITGIEAQMQPLLKKRQDMLDRNDNQPPTAGLQAERYQANEQRIQDLSGQLDNKKQELSATQARFDADKQRYIELTQSKQNGATGKPDSSSPVSPPATVPASSH